MKKTEKIEVRLSHEEKTALTSLAEQEGRSVSDLVRGLIERYMSINTQSLPRKTPWLKFGAIAVAGFFAGHLMTYFIAQSHDYAAIYNMEVNVGNDGISFPILVKSGEVVESVIPSNDGDIKVTAVAVEQPDTLSSAEIKLCRQTESTCKIFATPTLKFNPNRQSAIDFKEAAGKEIFIRLSPTIPARK